MFKTVDQILDNLASNIDPRDQTYVDIQRAKSGLRPYDDLLDKRLSQIDPRDQEFVDIMRVKNPPLTETLNKHRPLLGGSYLTNNSFPNLPSTSSNYGTGSNLFSNSLNNTVGLNSFKTSTFDELVKS